MASLFSRGKRTVKLTPCSLHFGASWKFVRCGFFVALVVMFPPLLRCSSFASLSSALGQTIDYGRRQSVRVSGPSQRALFEARPVNYVAINPPSTSRIWPVTMLDASEARKMAAPLSSSGLPIRPRGVLSMK